MKNREAIIKISLMVLLSIMNAALQLRVEHQQGSKIKLKDGSRGFYLAVNNKVGAGDYEWAFTGTQNYINAEDRYRGGDLFELRPIGYRRYLIVSNHGVQSYLAINGYVSTLGSQWAFFGSKEYLKDREEYQHEFYIQEVDGIFYIRHGIWFQQWPYVIFSSAPVRSELTSQSDSNLWEGWSWVSFTSSIYNRLFLFRGLNQWKPA